MTTKGYSGARPLREASSEVSEKNERLCTFGLTSYLFTIISIKLVVFGFFSPWCPTALSSRGQPPRWPLSFIPHFKPFTSTDRHAWPTFEHRKSTGRGPKSFSFGGTLTRRRFSTGVVRPLDEDRRPKQPKRMLNDDWSSLSLPHRSDTTADIKKPGSGAW